MRFINEIEPEWKPEVVCITGDIGWKGQASDYAPAGKWIRQLLNRMGLPSEALFMCPGNHDSNRSIAKLNKRPSSAADADEQLVTPIPKSLEMPFQAYADFSAGLNVTPYKIDDNESFLVGQRSYRGINFVSYNSAWYSQGNDDKDSLWIGLNLIKSLESKGQLPNPAELGEYPVTVALIHHPREWFHQEELHVHTHRPSTFDHLVRRCDLLLTGHVHGAPRPADQFAEAAWHLSGGATYAGASHFNSFRLIRVEVNRFVYQTFEYDPRSSGDNWRRRDDAQGTLIRVKGEENPFSVVSVTEVLEYLDEVTKQAAQLPTYYPDHLHRGEPGKTRFDDIRQIVQVIEDRSAFGRWLDEERERTRAAGQGFSPMTYNPTRARPETEARAEAHRDHPKPPLPVLWDERAGERFKRAIILGDPGFGKSWLLRYEARRLANDAAQRLSEQTVSLDELTLPIFASLPVVNQSNNPLEDALVELASKEIPKGGSDAFRHFVREKLKSDRCVILLDAWDEVPVEPPKNGQPIRYEPGYRQRLGERLKTFAHQFPQPRLLLTSRIVGYDSTHMPVPNLQELELLAFDSPQTESFVSVWFGDDTQAANQCLAMLRQNPQVRGLARIPLMLTLLCRTYLESQEKQSDFPTHRVELYDCCLRGLLRDWKGEKEHREISDAYVEAVLELLYTVSYTLFVEGSEQFSESDLRKKIIAWLTDLKYKHELDKYDATSIIAELKHDGILITAGEHRNAPLLFLHRTFHEYLTACMLAGTVNDQKKGWHAEVELQGRNVTIHQLVDRKAWDLRWQEVIILLAGKLENPTPLLEMLSKPEPTTTNPHGDDIFRHRLGLAALCLPEINSERRTQLAELADEITTTAFSLWYHNHRMQTRVATPAALSRALPALVQVNGQKNGVPLLEWICQNLSSEDEYEQVTAVEALSSLGSAAATPGVLGRLAQLLQGPVNNEWKYALHAVLGIGDAAVKPEILAPLIKKLHDGKLNHDYDANINYDLTELIEDVIANLLLNSDSGAAVVATITQLARSLQYPDLLEDMITALWNMDPVVMRIIADPDFVDQELSSEEVLLQLLQDSDVREWYSGLKAIFAPSYVPRYTAPIFWSLVLSKPDRSFADMDQWLKPTFYANLARSLKYDDMNARCKAARQVIEIGSAAAKPEILTGLAQLLQTRNRNIQLAEASALAQLLLNPDSGAANSDVLSGLAQLLQDENPDIKVAIARVLRAVAWSGVYFFVTNEGIKPNCMAELTTFSENA
jgi:predicted MPP superfamily phosphohydrolase